MLVFKKSADYVFFLHVLYCQWSATRVIAGSRARQPVNQNEIVKI